MGCEGRALALGWEYVGVSMRYQAVKEDCVCLAGVMGRSVFVGTRPVLRVDVGTVSWS